jgi:Meiotically Up-regulated Gene 113 (MUG113) protein
MTKEQILTAIRKAAAANGGAPLGRGRFFAETGIKEADWHGRYWVRWSDAVREAGFVPNAYNKARDGDEMLEKLSTLVKELKHFPVVGELKLRCRTDSTFPNPKTFSRFGSKRQLIATLRAFAQTRDYEDVVDICDRTAGSTAPRLTATDTDPDVSIGYVYLVQHGTRREFKVGRTNNPLRREGEIGIELPQRLKPVHVIETDDPVGIEAYWHRRFAEKRLKNEWFALSQNEVRAFRRWRKIL